MAVHFQVDNNKFTKKEHRVGIHAFESSVDVKGINELSGIEQNIDKWSEFIGFLKWYPDLFYDLFY